MWKLRFYFFLMLCFFTSCFGANAQKLTIEGITTIQLSYDNVSSDLSVATEIFHSFPAYSYSQVTDTLSINKSRLWLSCPVHVAQEGFVMIGNKKIRLFMMPSDTVFVKIDGQGTDLTYTIEGSSKQIQSYFQAKSTRFPQTIGQQIMDIGVGATDLFKFKTRADSLYSLEQAFWHKYEHRKLLPPWFIRYESDAIRYTNAWLRLYVLSYRIQVKRIIEKEPRDYFSFLEGLPVRNIAAQYDYEYLNFLREYISYKSAKIVSPKKVNTDRFANHEKAVELLGKEIGEFYNIYSISEALNDNPQLVITVLAKSSFSEHNDYLVAYLKQQASKRISILSAGKSSPNFFLVDSRDSLVSLSQFKGQVVYLSFWFAGCKGCIEEFPFENELVANFRDKPVKIISICTRTSQEKWLKTIDGFGLKTLNLYANSAWAGKLEEKFGINVYPHYVLIGADGSIVENFASRPSQGASGKIQEILSATKFN
jgi:peroxiredoxin